MLTSTSSLHSSLSACWLEEEDRVSYWQGLYGAWQGELQPVQLRGLEKEKSDKGRRDTDGPDRLRGDRSLNLLLQWTLTIIIFNPATDKWMDTAPQDFYVRGLVILWTACSFKKRILSMFLSASERVGRRWTNKEDTQILLRLLFFFFFSFKWRGKIFIFKLRFFFCPVWINMLFVIKWLFFFFLFVHSVSQANADTHLML